MIPGLTLNRIADHFQNKIKPSPVFDSAAPVKDQSLLVPEFRDLVNQMISTASNKGISIVRKETYRSNTLQRSYYNNGASKIASNGMHHYGIAWDLICLDEQGKSIDSGSDKAYREMRKVAAGMEIHLLPEWDAGHMQAVATSEQNALRNFINNYRASEFKGYILRYGSENHFVGNLKFALQKLGFYPSDMATNSDYFFGVTTEESVMKFQTIHGLTVDGIVGKQTILKLASLNYDIRH